MAVECFNVTGISHYMDNLDTFLVENDDYSESKSYIAENYCDGDRIYKYDACELTPVKLVDEPDNEFDPNAIFVEVAGLKVGYIKRGSTSHIRNLLKNPSANVIAELRGGPYKYVYVDENDKVHIENDEYSLAIKLTITTDEKHHGESNPSVLLAPEQVTQAPVSNAENSGQNRTEKIQPKPPKAKKKIRPTFFWIISALYVLLGLALPGIVYKVISFAIAAVFAGAAIKRKKINKDDNA